MKFNEADVNRQAGRSANKLTRAQQRVIRGPHNHRIQINEEFASEIFTREHHYQSMQNRSQHSSDMPVSERSAWN